MLVDFILIYGFNEMEVELGRSVVVIIIIITVCRRRHMASVVTIAAAGWGG